MSNQQDKTTFITFWLQNLSKKSVSFEADFFITVLIGENYSSLLIWNISKSRATNALGKIVCDSFNSLSRGSGARCFGYHDLNRSDPMVPEWMEQKRCQDV